MQPIKYIVKTHVFLPTVSINQHSTKCLVYAVMCLSNLDIQSLWSLLRYWEQTNIRFLYYSGLQLFLWHSHPIGMHSCIIHASLNHHIHTFHLNPLTPMHKDCKTYNVPSPMKVFVCMKCFYRLLHDDAIQQRWKVCFILFNDLCFYISTSLWALGS